MIKTLFYVSFAVVLIGAALNLTVITANGWHMPIAAETDGGRAGFFGWAFGGTVTSCSINESTRFAALADIFHIPDTDHYCSIGDIIAITGFLGVAVFGVAYFWMMAIKKEALKIISTAPSPREINL